MDNLDISKLSIDELDKLIASLAERRKILVEKRRAELLAELEKLGGIPHTAPPSKRRLRQHVPAYRDENGNYWAGRGPAPKWLLEHEAAGRDRSQFAIERT